MYTISDLLDLSHTKAAPLFEGKTYPYEVLDGIKGFILALGATLSPEEYDHPKEDVWIAKDAVIYPNNYIAGPCIIGHKTEVRPGAFIRGSALVGDNCVVGRCPIITTWAIPSWGINPTWAPVPSPAT